MQELSFNFYGQILDDDVRLGVFPISSSREVQQNYGYNAASYHFFRTRTGIGKVGGVAVLVGICWLVQRYFQDNLVFRVIKLLRKN